MKGCIVLKQACLAERRWGDEGKRLAEGMRLTARELKASLELADTAGRPRRP